MKKVLFGINSLHIGGIQTALMEVLQKLIHDTLCEEAKNYS